MGNEASKASGKGLSQAKSNRFMALAWSDPDRAGQQIAQIAFRLNVNARCIDPGTVKKRNVTQFDGKNWERYHPNGKADGYQN